MERIEFAVALLLSNFRRKAVLDLFDRYPGKGLEYGDSYGFLMECDNVPDSGFKLVVRGTAEALIYPHGPYAAILDEVIDQALPAGHDSFKEEVAVYPKGEDPGLTTAVISGMLDNVGRNYFENVPQPGRLVVKQASANLNLQQQGDRWAVHWWVAPPFTALRNPDGLHRALLTAYDRMRVPSP